MDQMSWLPDSEVVIKNEKSTLFITYQDQRVHMDIKEIFNPERYDEMIGVTYSISPAFLNTYFSAFRRIELVVGIPEEHVQNRANQMAQRLKQMIQQDLRNESVAFYENLSSEVKKQIANKEIEMKVPIGYAIHSKFYLLRNLQTGENRIILGSANLSEQAFLNTTAQFENIVIYDNHPLYSLYQDYFHNELHHVLIDYFPKELLAINAKRVEGQIKPEDEVIILGNEDVEKIRLKAITERIENLDRKIQSGIVPHAMIEQIKNIESDRWQVKADEKEETKREETAYTIVKESINLRTSVPQIKKTQTLSSTVKKNIEPLRVKVIEQSLTREVLYNRPDVRNATMGKSGLIRKSNIQSDMYGQIGILADKEDIKNALLKIHRFMETFEEFTFKYDDDYGQRIMEAILYTFTSPFLYEIKKLSRTSEERNDIPQFLFIGGNAGSGKSSLLKMIAKMLGIFDKPYWNFTDLGSGSRAKMERANTLRTWVSEENVCPILVDELDVEFFSNHNYGKRLILDTTNNKIHSVPPFPTVIGTTNADGYSLPAEARRRSYYLKIDKVFDPKYRESSPLAYQSIYEDMDDTLFLDFVLRMALRLEQWQSYNWNYFGEQGGKVDFLHQSREIFKEYYKLADLPLPRYFPIDRYNDDSESNQEKWRKLYKGMAGDHFKFDPSSGHLFLQTTIIDEYATRSYQRPESEVYKEALPQYVVHGSLQGINIELDTDEFFKWLEIDNPYVNYYKDILVSYYNKHQDRLKLDKETFSIPILDISDQHELTQRFMESMPPEVFHEVNDEYFVLNKAEFYQWTRIEPRRGWMDRFLGRTS